MRRYMMGVAALALVLAGCERGPTDPREEFGPQFASSQNTSISGKGTADQIDEFTILTYASFQCPVGETAKMTVHVSQASTGASGDGFAIERCKVGPNTVVMRVAGFGFGIGWDLAKAHAVWTISAATDVPTDEKDIMITAP